MRLQNKLFICIGVVLSISLAGVLYTDTVKLRHQFEADLRADAYEIQSILMATRRVYQKQFLDSGLPINDETIAFCRHMHSRGYPRTFPN